MSKEEKLKELEDIDSSLNTAMLDPERRVPIPNRAWWSDTIRNAHFLVQYWKTKMSLQHHNQHDDTALEDISNKLGPEVDIFQCNPSRSVSAQLRLAKKERKRCRNNSYKLCQ
eukprot:10354345-Ditylum_brightwellii.AAC.1